MLLLLIVLASVDPSAAAEQTVEQRVQRANALIDELEYSAAIVELDLALLEPGITDEQRLEVSLLAGVAHRVVGNDTDARMHFSRVLRLQPAARLPPDTPPKIEAFFELVREEVRAENARLAEAAEAQRASAPARAADAAPAGAAVANDRPPILLWSGVAVAGIGAAAAVGALGSAVVLEQRLGDPSSAGEDKAVQLVAGRVLLGGAGIAAVVAVVGAGVAVVGAIE